MKKLVKLLFIIFLYFHFSCTNNVRNQLAESTTSISEKTTRISKNALTTVIAFKDSIAKSVHVPKLLKSEEPDSEITMSKKDSIGENTTSEKLPGFNFFKKFLTDFKTGETLTQQELIEDLDIPKDGIRLIKSITKTAEDEIAIKWQSKWLIEKISDAKFTDAKMKIKFEADKIYVSGKAIAIKHNKKLYTDLIIIGNSAYIPSVKGYHWKIGK